MTKIRHEKCYDMNFNGNYLFFMSTLYTHFLSLSHSLSRPLVKKHTLKITKCIGEATNGKRRRKEKETNDAKVMKRKEKVYSLSTNLILCIHWHTHTQKRRRRISEHVHVEYLRIIYFISINPFICIIQGSHKP